MKALQQSFYVSAFSEGLRRKAADYRIKTAHFHGSSSHQRLIISWWPPARDRINPRVTSCFDRVQPVLGRTVSRAILYRRDPFRAYYFDLSNCRSTVCSRNVAFCARVCVCLRLSFYKLGLFFAIKFVYNCIRSVLVSFINKLGFFISKDSFFPNQM